LTNEVLHSGPVLLNLVVLHIVVKEVLVEFVGGEGAIQEGRIVVLPRKEGTACYMAQ